MKFIFNSNEIKTFFSIYWTTTLIFIFHKSVLAGGQIKKLASKLKKKSEALEKKNERKREDKSAASCVSTGPTAPRMPLGPAMSLPLSGCVGVHHTGRVHPGANSQWLLLHTSRGPSRQVVLDPEHPRGPGGPAGAAAPPGGQNSRRGNEQKKKSSRRREGSTGLRSTRRSGLSSAASKSQEAAARTKEKGKRKEGGGGEEEDGDIWGQRKAGRSVQEEVTP